MSSVAAVEGTMVMMQDVLMDGGVSHFSTLFPEAVLADAELCGLMPAGWTPAELLTRINGTEPTEEFPERTSKKESELDEAGKKRLTTFDVTGAMEEIRKIARLKSSDGSPFLEFDGKAVELPEGWRIDRFCQVFHVY